MSRTQRGRLRLPHSFVPLEDSTGAELRRDFRGHDRELLLKTSPEGWTVTQTYTKHADDIYNLPVRGDDVWVATFPMSGTVLTQELVWLVANNLSCDEAKRPLHERFPCLEQCMAGGQKTSDWVSDEPGQGGRVGVEKEEEYDRARRADIVNSLPSPRFLRTHLPFSLLPPSLLDRSKVVYVSRDVREVAVSSFYYSKWVRHRGFIRDFPTYLGYFIRDLVPYAPYCSHVLQAWRRRNHKNLLFLFYEDIVSDTAFVIKRVSRFLGRSCSQQQVSQLADFLHRRLRHPAVKMDVCALPADGTPGTLPAERGESAGHTKLEKMTDWRTHFSCEMSWQVSQWVQEKWSGTGLTCPSS